MSTALTAEVVAKGKADEQAQKMRDMMQAGASVAMAPRWSMPSRRCPMCQQTGALTARTRRSWAQAWSEGAMEQAECRETVAMGPGRMVEQPMSPQWWRHGGGRFRRGKATRGGGGTGEG